jgi:HlyD family secretion protein
MTTNNNNTASDVDQVLELNQPKRGRKWFKLLIGLVLVASLLAIGANYLTLENTTAVQYKTVVVQKGNITVTVTATGKLEPVNQVDVGTEISGTIESVNADYNDVVKVGQVLARIETDQLEAKFRQSKASLDLAKARVQEANATVAETRNKFQRSQKLVKSGACSQETCDADEAAYKRANATYASAKAQVMLAEAQLDADKTILEKAVIHSPINGIVLKRNVEPGQTVAASFQAPVLFTLAEDLAKMDLHVDIDEADVGQVKVDQKASFTVDAYPELYFSARILKVYYAPQVEQDVVTYEALLSVDNTELMLRPGMTATADIIIKKVEDVMIVPNASLRFNPPQTTTKSSVLRSILPGPPRRPAKQRKVDISAKTQQQIWILQDGEPTAIPVTIGATNGRITVILEGNIKVGQELLVDVIRATR